MDERRNRKYMLLLTPSERAALQELSEQEGSSGADVLRRLLRKEAYSLGMLPARVGNEVQNAA